MCLAITATTDKVPFVSSTFHPALLNLRLWLKRALQGQSPKNLLLLLYGLVAHLKIILR